MLYRALIKTHHMTSRKKIAAITKAAKRYECAVYLKTGAHPPGVMIAESEGEKDMRGWVGAVKVSRLLCVFVYDAWAFSFRFEVFGFARATVFPS